MSTKARVVVKKLPSRAFLLNPESMPAFREGSNDSDSECSEAEEEAPTRRARSFPVNTVGPFVQMPKTNKLKLTMVAGFADLASALNGDGSVVDLRWQDILKSANDAGLAQQLAKFDPQKCVPISLTVLGTNLGDKEAHCSIEVRSFLKIFSLSFPCLVCLVCLTD
jgi:hypothetical protein